MRCHVTHIIVRCAPHLFMPCQLPEDALNKLPDACIVLQETKMDEGDYNVELVSQASTPLPVAYLAPSTLRLC